METSSEQAVSGRVTRKAPGAMRWSGVEVMPYKEDGNHFRNISRQILFSGGPGLGSELRYFEVGEGGHSTLERHEHEHAVMVLEGQGRALIGEQIVEIGPMDVVHVPPMTWHQFHNVGTSAFGFLCVVNVCRDRPQRPSEADLAVLRANPSVAEFIRV